MKKAEEIINEILNNPNHKMTDYPMFSQKELIIDCIKEAQKDAIKAVIENIVDHTLKYNSTSIDIASLTERENELLKIIK